MKKTVNPRDYADHVADKLASGAFLNTRDGDRQNTMTIGWGGIEIIWNMPVFVVYVKTSRASFDLLEASGVFTVSVPLDDTLNKALAYCGAHSLREGNKFTKAHLTAEDARTVDAPIIGEAGLHIECEVVHKMDFDDDLWIESIQSTHKKSDDYHLVYYGKIVDSYLVEEA
jgi:flavin reductase (DIM6/NTAB) family NADH-FMN oxidoreductase RutF